MQASSNIDWLVKPFLDQVLDCNYIYHLFFYIQNGAFYICYLNSWSNMPKCH